MSVKPIIGVTGPDRGGFPAWISAWLAIRRAGGRAVRLRPGKYANGRALPHLDGLVIGGGADVDPGRYGREIMDFIESEKFPKLKSATERRRLVSWALAPFVFIFRRVFSLTATTIDKKRDAFEQRCLNKALAAGLPVLGICRGAQFINVHFGGTLHADVSDFYGEVGDMSGVYPRKRIRIAAGSRLGRILGEGRAYVNSLHRQAVDELGDGIVVSARDKAGVVQAIEHSRRPFVIGVQWHPEYLPAMRRQQRLFRALVHVARRRRALRKNQ